MTTTLPTRERRYDHPPHPPAPRPVRRVRPFDRLALRLGLLLITYGRRAHARSREQQAARRARLLEAERRQHEAARRLLLTAPPR